jgi:hypothetical protein
VTLARVNRALRMLMEPVRMLMVPVRNANRALRAFCPYLGNQTTNSPANYTQLIGIVRASIWSGRAISLRVTLARVNRALRMLMEPVRMLMVPVRNANRALRAFRPYLGNQTTNSPASYTRLIGIVRALIWSGRAISLQVTLARVNRALRMLMEPVRMLMVPVRNANRALRAFRPYLGNQTTNSPANYTRLIGIVKASI